MKDKKGNADKKPEITEKKVFSLDRMNSEKSDSGIVRKYKILSLMEVK